MTAHDHKIHAQDLFKRALVCQCNQTRDRLMELAKEHLAYYHELLAQEANIE